MIKQNLILEQTDKKILILRKAEKASMPSKGWIYAIRQALGMSLRQLGNRMGITPQSVREIEEREKDGTVSLKVLRQFGEAVNIKLIYGFIPEKGKLEDMIEHRAYEIAREIVSRTSATMQLEDQENSPGRIKKAVREKAEDLKREMPRFLWD
jgi:predicted DNA-binding mobile mystery protein A